MNFIYKCNKCEILKGVFYAALTKMLNHRKIENWYHFFYSLNPTVALKIAKAHDKDTNNRKTTLISSNKGFPKISIVHK